MQTIQGATSAAQTAGGSGQSDSPGGNNDSTGNVAVIVAVIAAVLILGLCGVIIVGFLHMQSNNKKKMVELENVIRQNQMSSQAPGPGYLPTPSPAATQQPGGRSQVYEVTVEPDRSPKGVGRA